jgi:hypothetical protein
MRGPSQSGGSITAAPDATADVARDGVVRRAVCRWRPDRRPAHDRRSGGDRGDTGGRPAPAHDRGRNGARQSRREGPSPPAWRPLVGARPRPGPGPQTDADALHRDVRQGPAARGRPAARRRSGRCGGTGRGQTPSRPAQASRTPTASRVVRPMTVTSSTGCRSGMPDAAIRVPRILFRPRSAFPSATMARGVDAAVERSRQDRRSEPAHDRGRSRIFGADARPEASSAKAAAPSASGRSSTQARSPSVPSARAARAATMSARV